MVSPREPTAAAKPSRFGKLGKFGETAAGLRRIGISRQNSQLGENANESMEEVKDPFSNVHSLPTESRDQPDHGAASTSSNLGGTPFEYASTIDLEERAINNSIDALKPSVTVFVLTILTSFCGFMFGYDTGYISNALVIMKNDLNTNLTSGKKELITSATSLGALITAVLGGSLADAFGRKWVIAYANVTFIVGAIMQTAAHSLWVMITGRFVMGFGVGLASLVAPLYLSEVAPTRFRGRLVVMNVLAITFGQLVAYAIGYGVTDVKGGWRISVGLSLVPSCSQMIIFMFMPESPRYLVSRGRNEEARKVLTQVYQGATPEQVSMKVMEITSNVPTRAVTDENVPYSKKIRSAVITFEHNLRELFARPSNLRGLAIIVTLQALQQFSGWNSLLYYSGTMFESVGFSSPTAVSIIIAATNFVFTGVAFLIIDRVGRRVLLVGTMWGMVVGLAVVAAAFHFLHYSGSTGKVAEASTGDKWSVIVIVFIFFFAMSYAAGIGNIPWQQSEMLPMQVRSIGSSFATGMNWAGSLIISATFLTMLDNITPTGTFAFYAGICLVGWILVIFFYPETAGLSLEEIQGLLTDGFNVRKSVALSKQKRQLLKPSQ